MTVSLQALIRSDRIPSLPEVALRVVEIAQQDEPDFDEMIRVIKGDPAICSRIMRTVNSALFGLSQRVSSIDAAVPVLGANLVRTLVLSFSLADHRGQAVDFRSDYQRLWRGSLLQAVAAESLAQQLTGVDESVWFLGALLQDIGRLTLLDADPETYAVLLAEYGDGAALLEAEQRRYGFTHPDVSMQLCLRWRLDNFLVDAVSKHHTEARPFYEAHEVPADLTLPYFPNAMRCAALIAEFVEGLRSGAEVEQERILQVLHRSFHVLPSQVEEMLREIDLRMSEIAALFHVDLGRYVDIDKVLSRAQATLADLALKSQLQAASAERFLKDTQEELEIMKFTSQVWQQKAQRDSLTGAYARGVLDSLLPEAVRECEAARQRLGILFLDLDRFKQINDRYGHAAGDAVLRHVVGAVKQVVRDCDPVIRYGGDEFVVLIPVASRSALDQIAARIQSVVAHPVSLPRHEAIRVTCSIGGVVYQPVRGEQIAPLRLLDEADQAMYDAKERGGNQTWMIGMKGMQLESPTNEPA